ncbi:MAG: glutaminyl-peptide cyclotransferase [Draconibacterium sp.]
MKPVTFPLILVFSLFVTFFSCSNKSSKSRKPVSTVAITPQKNNYVFGDKISVNVKTKIKGGEIESVKLFLNGQLLKESKEFDFTVSDVELKILGNSTFTVEAVKTDGQKNSRTQVISVFSNEPAQKYTYQVIKNYPHAKEHYTQGLEFYNNTLYEGTGEYGTSGLFKKRFETGGIDKTLMLDKQYFGEGITILNDKIYQLTYKNKTGFVYQLSDFALIDTFTFRSAEGWGLTNDGKNLIMSDGTQLLTWINPVDFSVVKTIQVANNRGLMTNLNELEYVNGTIYANIYTTDVIVQIDPETGKVISEINLSGILDMYKKPGEKIDYLNGIAFNKATGNLFVTGKYWPKMFEIKLIPSK